MADVVRWGGHYHVPGLKTWSGKQLCLGVYVTSKERREGAGSSRLGYRVLLKLGA